MIKDIKLSGNEINKPFAVNGQELKIKPSKTKITKPDTSPDQGKRRKLKKTFLILGIFLLFLVIVLLGTGWYGYRIYKDFIPEKEVIANQVSQLKQAIAEQNLSQVKQKNLQMQTEFQLLTDKVNQYSFFASLPVIKNYYADINHFLMAGISGTKTIDLIVEAITPYSDLLGLGGVDQADQKGKTTLDRVTFVVTTLDKIRPQIDTISQELEVARGELDQVDPSRYPLEYQGIKIRENLQLAIETLDQGSSLLSNAKPLFEVLPDLLGVNSPKYYFVLFQNDAELRPTGGFMTAYGILKIDKGKVSPVFSEDIYSLDASFSKRVPPPEPIKKYLKDIGGATMTRWYLRDMNFSPDFAESMQAFYEYYKNNTSGARKVDGIIAVDTELLANLLKIIGTVGVPEWGNFSAEIDKRCDCPQVVYRLEEIADKPVPGTKLSRKAVIGPLMNSVLANAFNSPKEKIAQLVNTGLTAIQEKHLMFYLLDEKAQQATELFYAAGRVREYDGDYLMLIDANLGGAKSDMFIERSIDQQVAVDGQGKITNTVSITYNNPFKASNCNLEKGDLCLNGLYRDYFRLYVPKGSQLIEATGSEVEVETSEELGKTVFAGFFGDKAPLRPQSKTKVTFKYQLPDEVNLSEGYRLLIQKQPGVDKYSYSITYGGDTREFDLRTDKELKW